MYPVERYLRTLKGYDVDTKLNQANRHESSAVNEPPSGLSVFSDVDFSKRGSVLEVIGREESLKMRHYIASNCDEARQWVDEHLEELRKDGSTRNLDKRHK